MRKRFHRTLSIRGTNFCACSASGEMWTVFTCRAMLSIHGRISSHTEHMRNEFHPWLSIRGTNFIAGWAYQEMFKVEYLSRIEYEFQKSRVTGPWDHKDSVSAEKVKKKISCLCTFKRKRDMYEEATKNMDSWALLNMQNSAAFFTAYLCLTFYCSMCCKNIFSWWIYLTCCSRHSSYDAAQEIPFFP